MFENDFYAGDSIEQLTYWASAGAETETKELFMCELDDMQDEFQGQDTTVATENAKQAFKDAMEYLHKFNAARLAESALKDTELLEKIGPDNFVDELTSKFVNIYNMAITEAYNAFCETMGE